MPALLWQGSSYLLVAQRSLSAGGYASTAWRLGSDGASLGPGTTSSVDAGMTMKPVLTRGGGATMLVGLSGLQLVGQLLDSAGAPSSAAFTLTTISSVYDFYGPQVFWNGQAFVATWNEPAPLIYRRMARRFDGAGTMIDTEPFVVEPSTPLPFGGGGAAAIGQNQVLVSIDKYLYYDSTCQYRGSKMAEPDPPRAGSYRFLPAVL